MKRREFVLTTATTAALATIGVEAAAKPKRENHHADSAIIAVDKQLGRENGMDLEVVYTFPYTMRYAAGYFHRTFTLRESDGDGYIRSTVTSRVGPDAPNADIFKQLRMVLDQAVENGHIPWRPDDPALQHGFLRLLCNEESFAHFKSPCFPRPVGVLRLDVPGGDAWMPFRAEWPKLYAVLYELFLVGCYVVGAKVELNMIEGDSSLRFSGRHISLGWTILPA